MSNRIKSLLIVLSLGLILPSVLFSLTYKQIVLLNNDNSVVTQPTQDFTEKTIDISVMLDNGNISRMDINDYLTSVLLKEMPAQFEMEALKAQAVVARTYVLRRISGSSKHNGAAVCVDSSCCQGYCEPEAYIASGGKEEDVAKVRQAVISTENLVLMYGEELIDATYFSSSGGRTEDALAVWGADIPYLQSTISPGEECVSQNIDTVTIGIGDFLGALGLDTSKNNVTISNITYTEGNGVDQITVCGKVFKGTQFRKYLGLRSTAFTLTVIGDNVVITTKGHGHRVGMSQCGAEAMAVGGSDYIEILTHYYNGAKLVVYEH